MRVASDRMIFIVLASILIGTLTCYKAREIEVFCPNGWLAKGQVIYFKNINNISSESKYSHCLICEQNSILENPYDILEVCVTASNFFFENHDMRCESAVCKPGQILPLEFEGQCKTLDSQPLCGMKMNMRHKTPKDAMKDVKFVSCKNFTHHHSFFKEKLYFSVDLFCPEGSIFESIKVSISSTFYARLLL